MHVSTGLGGKGGSGFSAYTQLLYAPADQCEVCKSNCVKAKPGDQGSSGGDGRQCPLPRQGDNGQDGTINVVSKLKAVVVYALQLV